MCVNDLVERAEQSRAEARRLVRDLKVVVAQRRTQVARSAGCRERSKAECAASRAAWLERAGARMHIYWKDNHVPQVDPDGYTVDTSSTGKVGER